MDPGLFESFRRIVYDHAGIDIREGKESLVEARLAKRLRALSLESEGDYLEYLKADKGDELVHFLDAISTNFTSFFREKDHFDHWAGELRRILEEGRPKLRIWCAAASSGEEPYTLAMVLHQALLAHPAVEAKILATDISTRVLAAAERGIYGEAQVKPVPPELRDRYLKRRENEVGEAAWEVKPELRKLLTFKRLNLAQPPFPMQGPLDSVFCRNVMIYFDRRVRQGLVSEIERLLRPGGVLYTGHAETLSGLDTQLKVVRPSMYRKPEGR